MYCFILGAEKATFCIKHIENKKIFFNIVPPRAPTNPFAGKRVIILYIIYVNGLLVPEGGGTVPHSHKCSPKTRAQVCNMV